MKIKIVIFRAPGIRVKSFHGTNKKERLNNLEKIQRRWGVCLTTYGKLAVSFPFFGTGNCCSLVVVVLRVHDDQVKTGTTNIVMNSVTYVPNECSKVKTVII